MNMKQKKLIGGMRILTKKIARIRTIRTNQEKFKRKGLFGLFLSLLLRPKRKGEKS